ncbi:LolA family protein [Lutibaculum baratangense]|uniref:Outer membrane lipoprotein carrier protein LolA n=1 Tax=Lutibaculum baratangense AMV1 TaxID=631454 RepID=V4RCR5_9HYPH|nr:outer-membrane lipoprotein carrier protein LolA [Lutibaculum baratangense]ESR23921.1 Outer membrane lipoprotein carrier protein LolA [Lutibaculum baratangense AMV1]
MPRLFATIAATVLITWAATAPGLARTDASQFSPAQLAAIEQLNTWLRGVVTLQGSFTQEGPDGRVTEGRFVLEKPGRLRFEYAPPSQLQVIADGFWLAVQDRKLKTTEKYPLSTTPLKLILDDKIDLLADADIKAVYASDNLTTVIVEGGQAGARSELALNFDPLAVKLDRWTITDVQGLKTTVVLGETVANASVDRKAFRIVEEIILQN